MFKTMTIPNVIDNKRKIFADIFNKQAPDYDHLSIATGYWDLGGLKLVLEQVKNYKKIRLLIGRELLIPRHKLNQPEPDYPDRDIFADLELLTPDPELRTIIKEIKDLVETNILEVRVYRRTFLHAKCYIFGTYESSKALGIIGSSNFTGNGLTQNTELNATETNHQVVLYEPKNDDQEAGHLFWFDELWSDEKTEPWSGKFVELLEQSPVGDRLFSPYETYIKTLYELYKDELNEEELHQDLSQGYELLEFQQRNVQQLIKKLKKHKTAMLSDSVGLGKTITAIGVIKEYTESPEGRRRVVVICPKSLKTQWQKELLNQGVYEPHIITLQNMNDIDNAMKLDHIASVALFVIDESHNLRKTTGARYIKLLDWVKNNKKAHVLLLTATPINNELKDLTNQILLGTRGDSSSIHVTNIDSKTGVSATKDFVTAVEDLQKKINKQINDDEIEKIDYSEVKSTMSRIIREVVVRRTRQGIEKEYGSLIINGEERKFPKSKAQNLPYKVPHELTEIILKIQSKSFDLEDIYKKNTDEIIERCDHLKHPLNQLDLLSSSNKQIVLEDLSPVHFIFHLILMLGFIPYRWKIYQTKYHSKTPQQIKDLRLPGDESRGLQQQRGIYGIFRTMFLKRMESSVRSIKRSVGKYRKKLEAFKEGVNNNHIISVKDIDAYQEALNALDESDFEDVENIEETILDEIDEYKYVSKTLKEDINKELELLDIISAILDILEEDDSKILALIEKLQELKDQKVLVFSYFADTIDYLRENIDSFSNGYIDSNNSAFLSSQNRSQSEDLAGRFSPNSKDHEITPDSKEIQYLFSTDILSEGQNLQDAGIIINYDLHWNPVRMIQRNGRINRLGSKFEDVFIYNMHPEENIEAYLKLVKRLEGKISMINQTIGNDQSVLGEPANPVEYIDTLENIYSDDENKRIQALLDSEEAGDFLLAEDEFVLDLKRFDNVQDENYKKQIYGMPQGKWGVFPELIRNNQKLKTPEVLVLSDLYNEELLLSPSFIRMTRSGSAKSLVPTMEALHYLKTTQDDNERSEDKISFDRKLIKETAIDPEIYLSDTEDEIAPSGQKLEILKIMAHLRYDIEVIELVEASFATSNHLAKKESTKLIRAIVKANRENQPFQNKLDELVKLAKSLDQEKEAILYPDKVTPILYYAKDNR
jgi:ERCC4-related helicase